MQPIYMAGNCTPAYQLNWSLAVFWRSPQHCEDWLGPLRAATEPDGVRILEHTFRSSTVSQFLLSTTPQVCPQDFVRAVKGRLQHIVRSERPKAFRRNYSFRSVGRVKRATVERYVRDQLGHHPMADAEVQERLRKQHDVQASAGISEPRHTSRGLYWYGLHLVFVNEGRWMEIRPEVLKGIQTSIAGTAAKRQCSLSRVALLPDHVHLLLGCPGQRSPEELALSFMNNVAHACGMRPLLRFSYYAGTVGEYDLGAVRASLDGPGG
jgi:REP element-mobilizing transposase RayT